MRERCDDLGDRVGELRDGEPVRALDDGRDEAFGAKIDGNREIHVRVQDERVAVHARVQVREIVERAAHGVAR